MHRFVLLAPALLLAACGRSGDGTNISITAQGDADGPAKVSADANSGRVSIDTPMFKANVNLPKFALDSAHMDIGGVKLFPGSKVEGVNVDANETNGAKHGLVRISFDAPGAPDAVKGWFQRQMGDAGFKVHAEGAGLAGTTDEGEPFALDLRPGDNGHTKGMMRLRDKE